MAVLIALWCFSLWQPERQLLLHHEHFIQAAEGRKWTRFAAFIDERYSDRWGHDKKFLVRESSEVLRQYFALTIQNEVTSSQLVPDGGLVRARLKLDGNGTAIAGYATQAVNQLREPFVFEWKRQSWKPWDWQLVRADNPGLRLQEWRDF